MLSRPSPNPHPLCRPHTRHPMPSTCVAPFARPNPMKRVAALVAEQGEVAERIDADVEAAGANIAAGHDELLTFYAAAAKNRSFILKVLGVMVFVVLLFAATRRV